LKEGSSFRGGGRGPTEKSKNHSYLAGGLEALGGGGKGWRNIVWRRTVPRGRGHKERLFSLITRRHQKIREEREFAIKSALSGEVLRGRRGGDLLR